MEGLDSMRRTDDHGMSYEDYIQVLVLSVSKAKKVVRGMDMIEDSIRKKAGHILIWIPVLWQWKPSQM